MAKLNMHWDNSGFARSTCWRYFDSKGQCFGEVEEIPAHDNIPATWTVKCFKHLPDATSLEDALRRIETIHKEET
jgi:hypothetical protein